MLLYKLTDPLIPLIVFFMISGVNNKVTNDKYGLGFIPKLKEHKMKTRMKCCSYFWLLLILGIPMGIPIPKFKLNWIQVAPGGLSPAIM